MGTVLFFADEIRTPIENRKKKKNRTVPVFDGGNKMLRNVMMILLIVLACLGMATCTLVQKQESLESKARRIHDQVLTVDTHCDTAMQLLNKNWNIVERHSSDQRGRGKIDLPRMAEGGLDAEFFAAFVGQGERTSEGYAKAKERAMALLDAIHKMCRENPSLVGLATTPEDAYRLEKEGKRAAFIGMENGYPLGKDLSLLEEYCRKGVRYLTLCHTQDNDICDSSTDRRGPEDNGLSEFGRQVVAECNRLGIMVDVSHISDKSFEAVLQVAKAPVIASHSCCRALCDSQRNLTDEMLKALAANGGVIQICFVSSYLKKPKPNPDREAALKALEQQYGNRREVRDESLRQKIREEYEAIFQKYPEEKASVKDVVDHIDYVAKLIGVDHAGIGTDFDGGGDLADCSDVSQMFRITEELCRRGYSAKDIEKIWGGNIMRVLSKVRDLSSNK
jgi:membrane dipeptidase